MRFGDYSCYALDLGDFSVDGGAMFGTIPKTMWEKRIAADSQNRIRLKARSLLIQGNDRNILVDTGFGSKLSEKMKAIYQITEIKDFNLILSGFDIDCNQISDVVLTHLHFDHAGGATLKTGLRVSPTFPNATYYIQTEQWEEALNPHERDKDSFLVDDFAPLESSGQLKLLDGSLQLMEGIEIMVSYNHTKAQQHVLVRDSYQPLFFCADLVPTVAHIPVPWHMAYDNHPLQLFPEKDFFLRKAVRENWIISFPHDPNFAAATLKTGDKWMEFKEAVTL